MAVTLGLRMEEMIFNLADTHLFFNDLEVRHRHLTHIKNTFKTIKYCCTAFRFFPKYNIEQFNFLEAKLPFS